MQIFCSRSAFECFKCKVRCQCCYCGPATPFAGSGNVSGLVSCYIYVAPISRDSVRRERRCQRSSVVLHICCADFARLRSQGAKMSAVGAAAPHGLTPCQSTYDIGQRFNDLINFLIKRFCRQTKSNAASNDRRIQ